MARNATPNPAADTIAAADETLGVPSPDTETPAQTGDSQPQFPDGSQETAANGDPAIAALFGPVLIIKGPAKGRWRAGRHFGPDIVTLPASELTQAQIEALMADPELAVLVG